MLCHFHVRRSSLIGQLGDAEEGVRAAEEAVEVTSGIGARLLELRAATDLAVAHKGAGRVGEAREVLLPICSWFTEGFDTPYFVAARAVLDRL